MKTIVFCFLLSILSGNLFAQNNDIKPGNQNMPTGAFRNFIGLNESLKPSEYILQKCQEMGIKILRKDINWHEVEKEKGIYDWTEMDWYVKSCIEKGIKPLLILTNKNKNYLTSATIPLPTNEIWLPFSKYVSESVKRYSKYNVMWELINEPNVPHMSGSMTPMQYIEYSVGLIKLIRNIDKNATIVGPGNGYCLRNDDDNWNLHVLKNLQKHALLDYYWKNINAWTGHHYTTKAPDNLFFDGVEMYDLQRQLIDRFNGNDIPYCNGERGFTSNPKPGQEYAFVENETRKTAYYLRQCLWGIYKEPKGFIINYVTYDVYGSGKEIIDTKTGDAIKNMLDILGDYTFKERVFTHDNDIVLLRFEKENESRYVVWCKSNENKCTSLRIKAKKAKIVDMYGLTHEKQFSEWVTDFEVNETPKFILISE